jgi:hypothetical protein
MMAHRHRRRRGDRSGRAFPHPSKFRRLCRFFGTPQCPHPGLVLLNMIWHTEDDISVMAESRA